MPESFGAGLRQRREQQQISLATIAEQTKIKLSLLEALERDDVSRWPSGIFRRAFVRTYAHAIGLDPDVVVREFLERYPDPIEDAAPGFGAAADADAASAGGAPPTRFGYLVGAAFDSLSQLRPGILQRRQSTVGVTAPDEIAASADDAPVEVAAPAAPDLLAAANLCTELGRVGETRDALPLLQEASRILDAVGLIVWVWDPQATELTPALSHGYSPSVLAQLPKVGRDADNATAAAFRSAQTSVVNGGTLASGALAVPLLTPAGCVGVLAIELPLGGAQREWARALVTIFAAQLGRLFGAPRAAGTIDRKLA
jgi:hypothetical protein